MGPAVNASDEQSTSIATAAPDVISTNDDGSYSFPIISISFVVQ